jgi:hypothetical protein
LIETALFIATPKSLNESMGDPNGKMIVEGLIQKAETKNGNGRIYPYEVLKREADKYAQGPIKERRALGELDHPECFISGYKILTKEKGWVLFENLEGIEHVATLNPTTQNLEYQKIERIINQHYEGSIIDIESKTFQANVTPNHRFLVTNQYDLKNERSFKFKNAEDICKGDLIPKRSTYNEGNSNDVIIENEKGKISLPSSLFSSFMGWWLSEGWLQYNKGSRGNISRGICVSQSKKENIEELDIIFKNLSESLNKKWGRHIRKNNEIEYYILDNVLYEYLSQFGLCDEKYIPNEIKNLNKENIQLFLNAYLNGDGSKQKNQEVYYTTSKQMALDISELINLTGFMSSEDQKELYFEKYLIEGKWIKDFDWYTKKEKYTNKLIEDKQKHYTGRILYSIRRKYSDFYHISDCTISTNQYSGNIHCVSVPNETILVMSPKGSTFWSGNSPIINLKNVSHNILDLTWQGKDLHGKIEILSTPSGNILKQLFLNKITVGISSRGMGSVRQIGETIEVQDDFELTAWDFVSTPSTPGAYMSVVNESINPNQTKSNNKYSKIDSLVTEIICNRTGFCTCDFDNI